MAKEKDHVEVVATLKESIEASRTKSRRLRFHTIRSLFGWKAWTVPRKELVTKLLTEQGILAQPSIADAGLDDWIVLSMPVNTDVPTKDPDPRPTDEWFHHLMSVELVSEFEVVVHFVSPLFHELDYKDMHEAVGFGFLLYEGGSRKRVSADLVYFAGAEHSKEGEPLVLVETKRGGRRLDAAAEQARSYASSLRPAYYVVTDGNLLTVWDYQGAVPDVRKMEFKREELQDRFDDLYRLLNRDTVTQARKEKIRKLGELSAQVRDDDPSGH
jgi:Type I restriction enzyme R protein N terminus (HSDR_N)